MDTNPETPVVTTPTVTVPSTTVQTLQSTVTSSSHVTPTLREESTTASKESGICEDEILKLFVTIRVPNIVERMFLTVYRSFLISATQYQSEETLRGTIDSVGVPHAFLILFFIHSASVPYPFHVRFLSVLFCSVPILSVFHQ